MRIAQLSDFHFTRITWNPFRLLSKRIFGNLNWLLNRENEFSEKQLEPLPALFRSLNVDLILFGGDFTTTAMKEEFQAAKHFIEQFDRPWIAIPGNHDHYTYRSYRNKHFYRYFSNQRKPSLDPFTLEKQGVEAHCIKPKWWIVALDTSLATLPSSSQGFLSKQLERTLEEVLQRIPSSDSIILLNHYPFFHNDEAKRCLKRGEALEALLKRHKNVRLYLHGHTHRHAIANLQSNGLPLILDSGSSTHVSHGAWNLLDLLDEGCRVTAYHWDGQWKPHRIEHISWTRL